MLMYTENLFHDWHMSLLYIDLEQPKLTSEVHSLLLITGNNRLIFVPAEETDIDIFSLVTFFWPPDKPWPALLHWYYHNHLWICSFGNNYLPLCLGTCSLLHSHLCHYTYPSAKGYICTCLHRSISYHHQYIYCHLLLLSGLVNIWSVVIPSILVETGIMFDITRNTQAAFRQSYK